LFRVTTRQIKGVLGLAQPSRRQCRSSTLPFMHIEAIPWIMLILIIGISIGLFALRVPL
jgi:hypothetical protein